MDSLGKLAIITGTFALAHYISTHTVEAETTKQAVVANEVSARTIPTGHLIQVGAPSFGKPAAVSGLDSKSGKDRFLRVQRPRHIPDKNLSTAELVRQTQLEAARIFHEGKYKTAYQFRERKGIPARLPHRNQQVMAVVRNAEWTRPQGLSDCSAAANGNPTPQRAASTGYSQYGGRSARPNRYEATHRNIVSPMV